VNLKPVVRTEQLRSFFRLVFTWFSLPRSLNQQLAFSRIIHLRCVAAARGESTDKLTVDNQTASLEGALVFLAI
jgi:hypothetical protein